MEKLEELKQIETELNNETRNQIMNSNDRLFQDLMKIFEDQDKKVVSSNEYDINGFSK